MDILFFDIDNFPDETIDVALKLLPASVVADIDRYKLIEDRKSRLIARLMIKQYVVATYDRWDWGWFEKDTHNKPYLTNGPYFNIAHSGKKVVVVFDDKYEVGIDIQEMKEVDARNITAFFHEDEITYLEDHNYDLDLFYNIWTKKEAFLKACGVGFIDGLDKVSVLKENLHFEKEWYYKDVPVGDHYKCMVCSAGDMGLIRMNHVTFEEIQPMIFKVIL